jgi:hypothetical protein
MANNKKTCPRKARIDAKAQKAIHAADPVLAAANPTTADLKKALQLARDTLEDIMGDHHLL